VTAHSDDVLVMGVILGDALAQAAHQGIKCLFAGDVVCASPDMLSYLCPRYQAALRFHQHLQQAVLLEREWGNDLLAGHEDAPALLVQ